MSKRRPSRWEAEAFVNESSFHWHQRFELAPGVLTPGVSDVGFLMDMADIPNDLSGMRVLDVGTTNGGAAIEFERRGADQVVAGDIADPSLFGVKDVLAFLDSNVHFVQASVYDLPSVLGGRFDLVAFWGVLYHLRHPLLALDKLRELTAGVVSIESAVADAELGAAGGAMVRFYRLDQLAGDPSNWFSPSVSSLVDWVSSCGFEPTKVASWPSGEPTRAMVNAVVAEGPPEFERVSYETRVSVQPSRRFRHQRDDSGVWTLRSINEETSASRVAPSEPPSTSPIWAEPPDNVPKLEDCHFYHTIELPKLGAQNGMWDLRPGIGDYLGAIDFSGLRVLEIGTANGFVCFELERRGAEVVAFDLDPLMTYDSIVALTEVQREEWRTQVRAMRNAFWLGHHLLGSRARLAYGHANHLPDSLGTFDAVVIGNVLQHLRDPIGALIESARRCNVLVVTEADWMEGLCDDIPAMIAFEDDNPFTWYQVKPSLIKKILGQVGFIDFRLRRHKQQLLRDVRFKDSVASELREWVDHLVPHYTVVAARDHSSATGVTT